MSHSQFHVRRMVRRGGVKPISTLIYEQTPRLLNVFLHNVIIDALTYTEHAKRKQSQPWSSSTLWNAKGVPCTDSEGWTLIWPHLYLLLTIDWWFVVRDGASSYVRLLVCIFFVRDGASSYVRVVCSSSWILLRSRWCFFLNSSSFAKVLHRRSLRCLYLLLRILLQQWSLLRSHGVWGTDVVVQTIVSFRGWGWVVLWPLILRNGNLILFISTIWCPRLWRINFILPLVFYSNFSDIFDPAWFRTYDLPIHIFWVTIWAIWTDGWPIIRRIIIWQIFPIGHEIKLDPCEARTQDHWHHRQMRYHCTTQACEFESIPGDFIL